MPTNNVNAVGTLSLSQLREKFPAGKYWNHAGNPDYSSSALDSLKPEDIVCYKNDIHSIYVIGVNVDTITYVSVTSAAANHITLKFSCSSATQLDRVKVVSTTSGEKMVTDYMSDLGNVSYTFNTSSMSNPGKPSRFTFMVIYQHLGMEKHYIV